MSEDFNTPDSAAERLMRMQLSPSAPTAANVGESFATEAEDLDELISQIVSADPPTRFFGIQSLRRRVTDDRECSYARLLHSKAFDSIIEGLSNNQLPDMQYECAWVLTNLLSGRQEKADLLSRGGLCQPLVKLLDTGSSADRTREQACWALANIVGECAEWRDQTLVCGLLPALTALLESRPSSGILEAASLLLVNLFREREPRVSFEVAKTLVPHMLNLMNHPHRALVPHLLWAMSYLIEDSEPRASLLLKDDLLQNLRRCLSSGDENQIVPSLRVLGNFASSMTLLPNCVLNDDLLSKMRPLLDHSDAKVRLQVLFFASIVSDGPDSYLEQIAKAGFLPQVGQILLEADEREKREAFWIVPNFVITRGNKFKNLVIEHCLEGFLETLTLKDTELTHCVLLSVRELLISAARRKSKDNGQSYDSLRKQIELCGGLKKIELVQNLADNDLVQMSRQIIDDFFVHNGALYETTEPLGEVAGEASNEEANGVPNEEANGVPNEEANGVPNEEANGVPNEEANGVPNEEANGVPNEEAPYVPNEEVNNVPNEETNNVPTEEASNVPTEDVDNAPNEEVNNVPNGEANNVPNEEASNVPNEETNNVPNEEAREVPNEEAPREVPNEEAREALNQIVHPKIDSPSERVASE